MVELDRAAEIRGGATPRRDNPDYWGGDVPWLTPTDLPPVGAGVIEVGATAEAITEDGLASCSASLLPPGTVLFSSRATIGKIGIAVVPLATNQGFANLIPRLGVESRYLAWCLHFHADRIAGLAGTTTFKEVP
ncbi:MAG: restriction endonuclease subunit S, partial [Rubrobacteraceae bacterium]